MKKFIFPLKMANQQTQVAYDWMVPLSSQRELIIVSFIALIPNKGFSGLQNLI